MLVHQLRLEWQPLSEPSQSQTVQPQALLTGLHVHPQPSGTARLGFGLPWAVQACALQLWLQLMRSAACLGHQWIAESAGEFLVDQEAHGPLLKFAAWQLRNVAASLSCPPAGHFAAAPAQRAGASAPQLPRRMQLVKTSPFGLQLCT